MAYFELLDALHQGDVIRTDGRKHFRFVFGTYQWERTTLFQAYLTQNTPLFGKCREISEEDAQKLLMAKGKVLSPLVKKADSIAAEVYGDLIDTRGVSYIRKLREEADSLKDWEEKITALLQNVCRDSDWTVEKLRGAGFTPAICLAVNLLTRKPGQSYGEYLTKLRVNRIARNVKLLDLSVKIDLDRLQNVTQEEKERAQVFRKARQYLYGDIPAFTEEIDERKGENLDSAIVSAMDVYRKIRSLAFGGGKIPHGISNPVLRMHGGKLCLAFFAYSYTRQNLEQGMMPRPSRWLVAELDSGSLIEEISCGKTDFSDAPEKQLCSTANPNPPMSPEMFRRIYGVLDEVRNGYKQTGKLDTAAYETYFEAMLQAVPPSYHRFYRELSKA